MKRTTKFFALLATLAMAAIAVTSVMAVPGNFGFDSNPVPDGTVITQDVIPTLPTTLDFDVADATNATDYDWRIWYPGSDLGGTYDLNLVDSGDAGGLDSIISIPTAALINTVIANGGEGTYTWTIFALDSGDTTETEIDGGPFTFEVNLSPGAFDFVAGDPPAPVANGGVLDTVLAGDLVFSVTEPNGIDDTNVDHGLTWYADAGATVDPTDTPALEVALVYNMGTGDWDLTLPAATVNDLPDGQYTWTIWAEIAGLAPTPVDGAPFTFTIARNPGAFDFVAGDPPTGVNGGTISTPLAADLEFSVTVPATDFDTMTDTVTWYADAGATVDPTNMPDLMVALTYDMGNNEYDLVIPASVVNGLADGLYTWTIWAENANGPTMVDGAPFSFTVDLVDDGEVPVRISPAAGETLTGPEFPMIQFEDSGEEWYQVWLGYGQASATPYAFNALFTWYPASDSSTGATLGQGICVAGICTIPVADTYVLPIGGDNSYEWWISYWSDGDSFVDINDSWNPTTFTIDWPDTNGTAIAATSPIDGSTLSAPPMEIVWPRQTGALWFQVWLGTGQATGWSNTLFFDWVYAEDICDATTCTWDVTGYTFTDNPYEMWVQIWGPNDFVDWNSVTDNPLEFTISTVSASN